MREVIYVFRVLCSADVDTSRSLSEWLVPPVEGLASCRTSLLSVESVIDKFSCLSRNDKPQTFETIL